MALEWNPVWPGFIMSDKQDWMGAEHESNLFSRAIITDRIEWHEVLLYVDFSLICLQKLHDHIKALETAPLSTKDKRKTEEVLESPCALDYISSEESENEHQGNGPCPRKVVKFEWERKRLRNIKAALDAHHVSTMTTQQNRTAAVVTISDQMASSSPPKDGPRWAIRQTETNNSEEWKTNHYIVYTFRKTLAVLQKQCVASLV